MILQEAPHQAPFVGQRLKNVIYLVLNHPPVRSEEDKRQHDDGLHNGGAAAGIQGRLLAERA